MSSYSSLSSMLLSLASEFKNEPKQVVISAMTSFLIESFDWMTKSEANIISVKAYEMRRLMDISADIQTGKNVSCFAENDVRIASAAFLFVKENSSNFTCAYHRIPGLWEMAFKLYANV